MRDCKTFCTNDYSSVLYLIHKAVSLPLILAYKYFDDKYNLTRPLFDILFL
jgi:hypothetical protein